MPLLHEVKCQALLSTEMGPPIDSRTVLPSNQCLALRGIQRLSVLLMTVIKVSCSSKYFLITFSEVLHSFHKASLKAYFPTGPAVEFVPQEVQRHQPPGHLPITQQVSCKVPPPVRRGVNGLLQTAWSLTARELHMEHPQSLSGRTQAFPPSSLSKSAYDEVKPQSTS